MQNGVRKIGAFFFMGIFFFNAMLYYAFMGAIDLKVKADMYEAVNNHPKNIVEFTVTANAFNTTSINEYVFEGKQYDIVNKVQVGKILHIYALLDTKESDIFNNVYNHISAENDIKGNTTHNQPLKNISKLYGQDYLPLELVTIVPIPNYNQHIFYVSALLPEYVSMGLIVPPPELS